jgi:hypothetical protein
VLYHRYGFYPKKAASRVANEGQAAFRILSQKQKVDTPNGMYPPQEDDSFKSRRDRALCGASISNPEFFTLISNPCRISGKIYYPQQTYTSVYLMKIYGASLKVAGARG